MVPRGSKENTGWHGHLLMVTRLMDGPISDDPLLHESMMGSSLVPLPVPSLPHQACHQTQTFPLPPPEQEPCVQESWEV